MYRVLESEMAFMGMSKKDVAEKIGLSYNTFLLKMGNSTKFSLDEAIKIKKAVQSNKTIEELFATENKTKEERNEK